MTEPSEDAPPNDTEANDTEFLNGTEFLDIGEAAALLRVSKSTIRARIRDGHLPAYRLSHKHVLVKRADLLALLTRIVPGDPSL